MKSFFHIDPEEVDRESAKLYASVWRTTRDEIKRKDALVLAQMRADQALEMAKTSGRTYKECLDILLQEEAIRRRAEKMLQAHNAPYGSGNLLGDLVSAVFAVFASFFVGVIVLAVTSTVLDGVARYARIDPNLPVVWVPCVCIAGLAALFVLIQVFMKVSRFLR